MVFFFVFCFRLSVLPIKKYKFLSFYRTPWWQFTIYSHRGFSAVHCCAYTLGYPSPKAPRDHLQLVFGRRGLLHKNAGMQAPEEGSPTNIRCKAPHLIKIILAYSSKKKRADPIEDESEVQQGHFCRQHSQRGRNLKV